MNPNPEPPLNNRAIEVLRWLCVLPAAILCRFVAYYACGILSMILTSPFSAADLPSLIYWIRFALSYLPRPAAFVIGGALTAPRYRLLVAIPLALVTIALSLFTHILRPDRIGLNNYLHFSAESAAALCGILYVAIAIRQKLPRLA